MTTDGFGIPTGPIAEEPKGFRPRDEQAAILRDALVAAGVQLGPYDDRIVEWMAGWEWSTLATVTSWIKRAADQS